MSATIVSNATVVLQDSLAPGHSVRFEDGRITAVCPTGLLGDAKADQVIDARGKYIAPGFIDLHLHGTGRFLTHNGPTDLADLCGLLPEYGVTGFLPTFTAKPKGQDAEFLASLAAVPHDGCAILGFHLEGPFLKLTGAMPPEALGSADAERVEALIEAARPYPAIFSISPDKDGVLDLIPLMAAGPTPVFMTHTIANVEQTQAAIEVGACHATHFYDVFPTPEVTEGGRRPCGAVEAILADPRVTVDFILDGVHVHPVAVQMALQCKGPGGVCLITDANAGAGMPPGRYRFGCDEIEFAYEGAPARMTEKARNPGGLTGSGLTLDRAVRNAREMLDVPLPQAVRMASGNPASVLALADRKGQVREGFDADLVVLDESLEVTQTWVGGQCVFSKEA